MLIAINMVMVIALIMLGISFHGFIEWVLDLKRKGHMAPYETFGTIAFFTLIHITLLAMMGIAIYIGNFL